MKWFHKKFNAKPILDRYMDADFELFACGKDAPSEKDVHAFEQTIGFGLPPEFVEFSTSPLGGVYIAVKEAIWARPQAYAVGPFWSFLYGLHTMGFGKGIPEWMDIRIQAQKFKTDTGHNVVPFLKVIGDADVYCFDSRGEIVRWDHETDELQVQGRAFAEVLEYEVAKLKDRKERKKQNQELEATRSRRTPEREHCSLPAMGNIPRLVRCLEDVGEFYASDAPLSLA